MGSWTLDEIAESVLRNDDISISLTEAILAALDIARLAERGECICIRCGQRQDPPKQSEPAF